jgi:hypothetical protein
MYHRNITHCFVAVLCFVFKKCRYGYCALQGLDCEIGEMVQRKGFIDSFCRLCERTASRCLQQLEGRDEALPSARIAELEDIDDVV